MSRDKFVADPAIAVALERLQLAALDHEIRKAEHTYSWLMFVREARAKWRRR